MEYIVQSRESALGLSDQSELADEVEEAVFNTSNPDIFYAISHPSYDRKNQRDSIYEEALEEETELSETALEPDSFEHQLIERLSWYSESINNLETGPAIDAESEENSVEQIANYILEETTEPKDTIVIAPEHLDVQTVLNYHSNQEEYDFQLDLHRT